MSKIYKYALTKFRHGVENHILMNKGAQLLAFKIQYERLDPFPVIWALTDNSRVDDTVLRTFILHFTGDSVSEGDMYLGTDIDNIGLVWHCFERYNV